MKKILMSLSMLALLISCRSIDKKDIYKEYKPKNSMNIKFENSSNKEILNNVDLKNIIFNRDNRKINKNIKGVWVATVLNLDFPKTRTIEGQKNEIIEIMENVKKWGLNAVFFQIRPAADVFYNSNNEPWSIYLTGFQNMSMGYDPLKFAIEEAHKRNIELHAWINPYRASMTTDLSLISEKSVVKKHPEWIFEFDGKFYMNPGNPEVVEYVSNEIEYIVKNYDVDGIHLDDYFYPYPSSKVKLAESVDDKEFFVYSKLGQNKENWRRENVNNMIQNLSISVHKIKPNLSFGISPFGIWRNNKTDIDGSMTSGLESYDSLYADSIKWMKEGWVDYIAPQIYWHIGHEKANYEELVKWWARKSKETKTPLYIGQGIYKYNEWKDPLEVSKQLNLNNKYDNINGSIFFRYTNLLENKKILEQINKNIK